MPDICILFAYNWHGIGTELAWNWHSQPMNQWKRRIKSEPETDSIWFGTVGATQAATTVR